MQQLNKSGLIHAATHPWLEADVEVSENMEQDVFKGEMAGKVAYRSCQMTCPDIALDPARASTAAAAYASFDGINGIGVVSFCILLYFLPWPLAFGLAV